MDSRIGPILTELKPELQSLYGERLARLVLFGSHARDEAVSGSDIDLLVVLRGSVIAVEEIQRTGPLLAALSLKYDHVVSCTYVSADRYASERSPLLINIHREGVNV